MKMGVMNNTISLGKPITAPCLIPVEHKATPNCINQPFMINGECYKVTAISLGSPHGAVFVDDMDSIDVHMLGSLLGSHQLFPKGASIVFIQILDKASLKARLWQRNEGEAAFTPEAAGAAGVTAMMMQKILTKTVNVSMGENMFQVAWDIEADEVRITGPL